MGMRTLWAIHAGKSGDAEPLFLGGVIGLGWEKVGDLTGAPNDRAVFKSRMAVAYPDKKEAGIPVSAGQLYRFVHEVKEGDVVLFSSNRDQTVRFGRIDSSYSFAADAGARYPHRRKVTWLHQVPRATFSQDAVNEVNSAMSFFRV